MTNFDNAYKSNKPYKWRSITFTVTSDEHELILNIADREGRPIPTVVSGLVNEAIQRRLDNISFADETPKTMVMKALSKVRKRQQRLYELAEIRSSLDEKDFLKCCAEFEISPEEVSETLTPVEGQKKLDRCRAFLRVLFTDRPEGLPVNHVLEIAQGEGFGTNLTRDASSAIGNVTKQVVIDGKRTSFWIPAD